jgi:hypothetical protein
MFVRQQVNIRLHHHRHRQLIVNKMHRLRHHRQQLLGNQLLMVLHLIQQDTHTHQAESFLM